MLYATLAQRGPSPNPDEEFFEMDAMTFIIQHSTFHHIWSVGIGLIIYACYNGAGGIVNSFLSWSWWQPLARLTYTWYLLHYPLKTITKVLDRYPDYFGPFPCTIFALGILLMTIFISIPWTLAFEIPFLNLQRYLESGHRASLGGPTEKSSLKTITSPVASLEELDKSSKFVIS